MIKGTNNKRSHRKNRIKRSKVTTTARVLENFNFVRSNSTIGLAINAIINDTIRYTNIVWICVIKYNPMPIAVTIPNAFMIPNAMFFESILINC